MIEGIKTIHQMVKEVLEQQVEAGMENWAVGLHDFGESKEIVGVGRKRLDDYPVALKKRWGGDLVGRSIHDMSWVEAKTGFYFLDTYDEDMTDRKQEQGYFALFYYDADKEEGAFIHYRPDFGTTLKYRLAGKTREDLTINLQDFIQSRWILWKGMEEPPYDCLDLFYLGRECKPLSPPLGIFNWSW